MINDAVKETLYRLNIGLQLDLKLLNEAFLSLFQDYDNGRDVQLGAILVGLMSKGPTLDEVCCLIDATLAIDNLHSTKKIDIALPKDEKLVTVIGSGKKGFKTFNISTPALVIAASAGAYCYKPVSSATSSITGSADFLRGVGVNLEISASEMSKIVSDIGFGAFCIENLIPKFDKVYGGKFFAPQILSFGLPSLVTPFNSNTILYGLAHPNIQLSAQVLKHYGFKDALIISSTYDNIHYIDESCVFGESRVIGILRGNIGRLISLQPGTALGLPNYSPNDIKEGRTIEENISFGLDVICGNGDAAREDTVCLNAGNILYLSGKADNYTEGYQTAKRIVKTKKPIEKLFELIEATGGNPEKTLRILKK